ncbi:MAG TPA: hypothetical protein VFA65_24450 [Bryobacteraceae bacterium]|nr:hypothetical protein [Bryobacteraceae bacterium]
MKQLILPQIPGIANQLMTAPEGWDCCSKCGKKLQTVMMTLGQTLACPQCDTAALQKADAEIRKQFGF